MIKGISITLSNIRYNVSFRVHKEKYVICTLKDSYGCKFKGKAICDSEDVFDEHFGAALALEKALNKRQTHIEKRYKRSLVIRSLRFQCSLNARENIEKKFMKKNKLSK